MNTSRFRVPSIFHTDQGAFRAITPVVIVGCGGTGAYVAEGVCRLLQGSQSDITIVDYDTVEERNVRRQQFFPGDVGQYKAEVVAKRLARQFRRTVGYSTHPWSPELRGGVIQHYISSLIIGCVDNPLARRAIADSIKGRTGHWWLDAGNGDHSGQIFLGNVMEPELLNGTWENGIAPRLPAPALQSPALLELREPGERPMNCAEAIEQGDQSPTINHVMASIVLEFIRRLITGECYWMQAYVDLEAGTMRTVDISTTQVARITGMRRNLLLKRQGGIK